MTSKFIIRLDDACPTNDLTKWDYIEHVLDSLDIKPIVAVIPNNQDPSLFYSAVDENFWQRIRRYQAKGWTIALHGFNHCYTTVKGGLIPINNYSEFAGVPLQDQIKKIDS